MRINNNHLNRESYLKVSRSVFDNYKNLGYNYKNNLFINSLSSLFYLDNRKIRILNALEPLIYYLIERVKEIKKSRNYAISKDSTNIN